MERVIGSPLQTSFSQFPSKLPKWSMNLTLPEWKAKNSHASCLCSSGQQQYSLRCCQWYDYLLKSDEYSTLYSIWPLFPAIENKGQGWSELSRYTCNGCSTWQTWLRISLTHSLVVQRLIFLKKDVGNTEFPQTSWWVFCLINQIQTR